ncbi:MAG: tryptophan--tRNA ligase [Candidatus Zambryskibacteria bacterium RIFCSPLOWO2_01_FULL_43_17]|uniref:Tryptophan--tRNA ligase n=1 Tax=Candidatus Zambryskibacteria bacterium RIFCSPLOWO2_01_FULL_43_17 TaxID=1802760 RepID=A0A1G2U2E5_9BACT|nr:MAG: tryptophan--tRNA ligase [Candidatus Zambryskibacteria bacterium RIFCSPLOWO2_01_FULL_43_17]
MNDAKILLSGVKPTGRPHIGNYFGAMKQFVDLQNDYECFFMIADYHALNFVQNGKEMKGLILDLALDYLAIGIDPVKSTIFQQSAISEHTELSWIFEAITTVPYLERAHAFKDAESRGKEVSVGTFNYPMLMAADILLYDPDVVPVGQDQKQHIEITRDTAEKFNRIFGETFKLPEALILESVKTVPGTDGQKMSKSHKNTIGLFASDEEIADAVMKIPTDSKGVEDPKDPETDNVFALHKLFTEGPEFGELRDKYEAGGIGYKESKEILIKNIVKFVTPIRERRASLEKDIPSVIEILRKGAKKAKQRASEKMADVRMKVGVTLDK